MAMLLPPERIQRLSGFGMASQADGYVFFPENESEVRDAISRAISGGRRLTMRGAARSYGDCAIGAEHVVLDMSHMNRILNWDSQTGIIEVEAGVNLGEIWRHVLPDGFWLPVVSGTMFPTVGGSLAMNIHGKNNFKEGPIGEHVAEIEVLTTAGEIRKLTPNEPEFYGVISGCGLVGIILRAKLRMKKVASGALRVRGVSCSNWDEQFRAFELARGEADYMVSWIDGFAQRSKAGRGLFHQASYAQLTDNNRWLTLEAQALPTKVAGIVPPEKAWKLLRMFNNSLGVKWINSARYLAGKREHDKTYLQSLAAFSFLLDYIPNWRNVYLPDGFIQYQSFVPAEQAKSVFAKQIELLNAERCPPFLAVLKQHRHDDFLLSHGVNGYSLALDLKVRRDDRSHLWRVCHQLNDLVLEAGGRFYFAKDSTTRPEDVARFLGEGALQRFADLRIEFDPAGILSSEMAKRLGLENPRAAGIPSLG